MGDSEGVSGLVCNIPIDVAAFNVDAAVFTSRTALQWLQQLLEMAFSFVLHIDGKYKLHHGQWVLLTLGTHFLL